MCIVNGNVYQVMDYSEVTFVLGPMIKLTGSFFLSVMSTLPMWLFYCSLLQQGSLPFHWYLYLSFFALLTSMDVQR